MGKNREGGDWGLNGRDRNKDIYMDVKILYFER